MNKKISSKKIQFFQVKFNKFSILYLGKVPLIKKTQLTNKSIFIIKIVIILQYLIKYKCSVKIPRNCKEAVKFDTENGNTLWQDALAKEMCKI